MRFVLGWHGPCALAAFGARVGGDPICITRQAPHAKGAGHRFTFFCQRVDQTPLIGPDQGGKGLYRITPSKAGDGEDGTKVEKVNVLNLPGKFRRILGRPGRTKGWRKAVVRLQDGDSIDIV